MSIQVLLLTNQSTNQSVNSS